MRGYRGTHAYQAAMVGRGRRRGGDVLGALEEAAENGDVRAQAMCDALEASGCADPAWRKRRIAPGVNAPCDDLYPLPFRSADGSNVFVNGGVTTKRFEARPQKPFRGERPVALVTRVGAGAAAIVPVIRGGILVGTDPQIAQVADQPIEFFDRQSFGVRMVMTPSEPGVDIAFDVALVGGALAAGETITVFFTVWGSTLA